MADVDVKLEILWYLETAISRYPRPAGESLKDWFDRVLDEHLDAPEYALAYAVGLGDGADIDILGEAFEALLGRVRPRVVMKEERWCALPQEA